MISGRIILTATVYIIDHRYRANRIVHEKLTGISLYPGIPHDASEQE
jgi:hypothetical protein